MSARDELREELVRPKRLGEYYLPEGAEDLISRVRAEVLREAADEADARAESHTVAAVADMFRRMADAAERGDR
ncbi:hypothetical protein [Streptomyces sulphureus]|uniref:hypothetical protein n=1 Tax=Streptomyces sulphureus TaxID=47758 RepID=UPI000372226F|nr:hypothetical protein [Streptomyces sulphureus]